MTVLLENVKALCLDNEFTEEHFDKKKEYEAVFSLDNGQYGIKSKSGNIICVPKNYFKLIYGEKTSKVSKNSMEGRD